MNKTVKILSILMIVVMLITVSTKVFAAGPDAVLDTLKDEIAKDDAEVTESTKELSVMAAKVIKLIRNVAVILAVVLITILGVKYMMGSAEEKSGYQKSFIPLIVGIVVVVAATQIATMLFGVI